jgi:hypothetical protein
LETESKPTKWSLARTGLQDKEKSTRAKHLIGTEDKSIT